MNFMSDTAAPAHPVILEAMVAAAKGPAPSYGSDPWTKSAREALTAKLTNSQPNQASNEPKKVTGSTLPQPETMVMTNQCMAAGIEGNTSGWS